MADVEADAKRTAKDIAEQLAHFFVEQSWIPVSVVQQKGEISMYRRLSMVIAAIIIIGFWAGPAASSDDNSCWLEAQNTVYLSIYDLDSLGSILSHIWEGVLKRGDKKLIKSTNGKIRYYTNLDAAASSPGVNLACTNNETIGVP